MVNFQIFKAYVFFSAMTIFHITYSRNMYLLVIFVIKKQFHKPKISTVKYGTKSLSYNAPLIWNNFSRNNRNQFINILITKIKPCAKQFYIALTT